MSEDLKAKDIPILSMENITKIYPNGFIANKNIDFSVRKGEIHALLGENGAGKSTLMKVLFGQEHPDNGRILLEGKEINITNPDVAIKYGIGMVHQHFMLVPSLTVAENLVLGMEPKKMGLFDIDKAVELTEAISKKYNLHVDTKAKVEDISVGIKQKVEILKVLLRGARIIILDEPTAVLTPQETKELFGELISLKNDGYTIIFISHKLDEIKAICDRLTILRNGKLIGVSQVADVTEQQISRMMVGRDVIFEVDKEKASPKDVVLKLENIELVNQDNKKILNDVSLQVKSGQIVGIAGVEGNGQREISELITGLSEIQKGSIKVNGININNKSIREIRELGVAHVSEDRMTYGSVPSASVRENMISDRYYKKEYNNRYLLDKNKINKLVKTLIDDFTVKCDGPDALVKTLSGGNIQKVVVSREFSSDPSLVIANQPTRGIDVGASEFIRQKLIKLRDQGAAILLITADLNEVLEVSDSLVVMSGGEIVAYFEDSSLVDEISLGEYMLGIKKQTREEIKNNMYN